MRASEDVHVVRRAPAWGAGLSDGEVAPVRRSPLLIGLGESCLRELLAGAFVGRVHRRALLYRQGEEASRLHVILDGCGPYGGPSSRHGPILSGRTRLPLRQS